MVTYLVLELDYPFLHISALEDVYINSALYKCFLLTYVSMEAGTYNLRSNRTECSIPVQLQLATAEDFVMEARSQMESDQAGQVFSELSDCEPDIDLSDLIWHSDQNLSPIIIDRQSAFSAGGGASVPSTSVSSTSEKAAINPKILDQLNALGQRLGSIEKSTFSNGGTKTKVELMIKKLNCQSKAKAHVPFPQCSTNVTPW